MARLSFRVEATKSRSGVHAERRLVIVFRGNGRVERILTGEDRVRGTYSRGSSWTAHIDLEPGDVAVYVRLVRGLRGRIGGYIEVYDHEGNMVFRAVIRRRKTRASKGDPRYSSYVEKAIEMIGLGDFIRKYNWSTAPRRG
ncbi:MAG: hypothetical protein F7C08_00050 [Desulfurococcales archaeon]|nr:hypothetical protein [Desulfurococcales archaeon]MCE4604920.1 hypothetical protein [Desulfurococcales archaeon]